MDIDKKKALDLVTNLIKLDGISGKEKDVADFIEKTALKAGVRKSWIKHDSAHTKSPCRGNTGNMIITLPGTIRSPRIMFSAHIDTVEIAQGSVPVKKGNFIYPKGKTALGADDRAGTAVLLNTLVTLLDRRVPHPPLSFLFTVQEEIGLFGARFATPSLFKKPLCCYNIDGSKPGSLVLKAPSSTVFSVAIQGHAAHAGQHPDKGASAILMFAQGLAEVKRKNMFGEIKHRGIKAGTSNIGVVKGGTALNVVADKLTAEGEARSYRHAFLRKIISTYKKSFENAARSVRNTEGKCGRVRFTSQDIYQAFDLKKSQPAVKRVRSVLKQLGIKPSYPTQFGGLDANWINTYGIPTVTLGAGGEDPHTDKERLNIARFYDCCRVCLLLAGVGNGI